MGTHHNGLGELEEAIMEILWTDGAATVRKVVDRLQKERDLAYTTVMTVMTRLMEKKLLSRQEQRDGSFLYTPRQTRVAFYRTTSRAFFQDALKRFGTLAVAQFIDVLEEVDPKQIQMLRKRLSKKS